MREFKAGEEVRWFDRKGVTRRGTVLSVRTTSRTGKVWAQVQVKPCVKSSYAGQKSIPVQKLEVKGE